MPPARGTPDADRILRRLESTINDLDNDSIKQAIDDLDFSEVTSAVEEVDSRLQSVETEVAEIKEQLVIIQAMSENVKIARHNEWVFGNPGLATAMGMKFKYPVKTVRHFISMYCPV